MTAVDALLRMIAPAGAEYAVSRNTRGSSAGCEAIAADVPHNASMPATIRSVARFTCVSPADNAPVQYAR